MHYNQQIISCICIKYTIILVNSESLYYSPLEFKFKFKQPHQLMSRLTEIYKFYALKLNTTEHTIQNMITNILKGNNPEEELLNLMGYDSLDDISYVIQNYAGITDSRKSVNNKYLGYNEKQKYKNANSHINLSPKKSNLPNCILNNKKKENNFSTKNVKSPTKSINREISPSRKIIKNIDKIETVLKPTTYVKSDHVLITIPPKSKINHKDELRTSIEELAANDQPYFPYSHFNPIQSKVYQTAYHTNKNFLVSAPTGCGKTDIALLTILKAINQSGKTIYIAPMKALATEIVFKLRKTFKNDKNIKIIEFTGDVNTNYLDLKDAKILVSTPEKFDVSTRRLCASFVISLLIIDEIHILHDRRGSVIESIVCRVFRNMELSQKQVRIVGLSATLPNYEDVARFIQAEDCFYFDSAYRPVPLEMFLIGVRKKNDVVEDILDSGEIIRNIEKMKLESLIQDKQIGAKLNKEVHENRFNKVDKYKNNKYVNMHELKELEDGFVDLHDILPKAAEKIECSDESDENKAKDRSMKQKYNDILADYMTPYLNDERQILVFVTSRKETERTQNYLQKIFTKKKFGIHHAGLPRRNRLEAENRFRNKEIDVLITTSTLAWGVNLPARVVFIKGTTFFCQDSGRMQNLSILDILQIFGRAGRIQFDNVGYAYLITDNTELSNYYNLINNKTLVESKLLYSFIDILNTEIYLRNITNLYEAIQWMKSTFLFIRMLRAPIKYGFTKEEIENDDIDKVLADYICIAISKLIECRLIAIKTNLDTTDKIYTVPKMKMEKYVYDLTLEYHSTTLGRIASFNFISHDTIFVWLESFECIFDQTSMLEVLFESTEFSHIVLRDDEIEIIKHFCADFNITFEETTTCKLLVLFNVKIKGLLTYSMSLACDQTYMLKNMERLVLGMKEIIISERFYQLYGIICEIERIVLGEQQIGNGICSCSKIDNFVYFHTNLDVTVIEKDIRKIRENLKQKPNITESINSGKLCMEQNGSQNQNLLLNKNVKYYNKKTNKSYKNQNNDIKYESDDTEESYGKHVLSINEYKKDDFSIINDSSQNNCIRGLKSLEDEIYYITHQKNFFISLPQQEFNVSGAKLKMNVLSYLQILQKFGVHYCSETKWSLFSEKKSCAHFDIIDFLKYDYNNHKNKNKTPDCCLIIQILNKNEVKEDSAKLNKNDVKEDTPENTNDKLYTDKNNKEIVKKQEINIFEKNCKIIMNGIIEHINVKDMIIPLKWNSQVEFDPVHDKTKFRIYCESIFQFDYEEIDSVNFKERQKIITRKIAKNINSMESIVIVPDYNELKNTENDIRTLLVLKAGNIDTYDVSIGFKTKKEGIKIVIIDFEQAVAKRHMFNENHMIYFKGIQNKKGLYSMYDLVNVVKSNMCLIYETKNIIDYFKGLENIENV